MRFAYADPPYLGQGAKYASYHKNSLDWDDPKYHKLLIDNLSKEYPDGWALSASSPSLRVLLPMCPDDVRIAVWCKTFCAFKKGVRPAYGWEPVIFRGGRNKHHPPPVKGGKQTTPKDFHEADGLLAPIAMMKGLPGAKPESVCRWILNLLNVQPGDTVVDLFPGTGVMGRIAPEFTQVRCLLTCHDANHNGDDGGGCGNPLCYKFDKDTSPEPRPSKSPMCRCPGEPVDFKQEAV